MNAALRRFVVHVCEEVEKGDQAVAVDESSDETVRLGPKGDLEAVDGPGALADLVQLRGKLELKKEDLLT